MTLGSRARLALRIGAGLLFAAAVVLAVVAVATPSRPRVELAPVDPAAIALPAPGLLGGSVTVYGASPGRAGPEDLGCRLLDREGEEQSRARLSALRVVGDENATLDGRALQPLFRVTAYPRGSTVVCDRGAEAAPMAVSAPSTLGSRGGLVRATAAGGALVCLGVGAIGLVLSRPRGSAAAVRS